MDGVTLLPCGNQKRKRGKDDLDFCGPVVTRSVSEGRTTQTSAALW
jgi:hypothetical protein